MTGQMREFNKYPIVKKSSDGSSNIGCFNLDEHDLLALEPLGPGVYVLSPEIGDFLKGMRADSHVGEVLVPGPMPSGRSDLIFKSFRKNYEPSEMGEAAWEYALVKAYSYGGETYLGNFVSHVLRSVTVDSESYWDEETFYMLAAYNTVMSHTKNSVDTPRSRTVRELMQKYDGKILERLKRRQISSFCSGVLDSMMRGGFLSWDHATHRVKEMLLDMPYWVLNDMFLVHTRIPDLCESTAPDVREREVSRFIEMMKEGGVNMSTHDRMLSLINDAVERGSSESLSAAEIVNDFLGSALFIADNVPDSTVEALLDQLEKMTDLSAANLVSVVYAITHPTYIIRSGSTDDVAQLVAEALRSTSHNQYAFIDLISEILNSYDGPLPTLGEWQRAIRGGGDVFRIGAVLAMQFISPTMVTKDIERSISYELRVYRSKYGTRRHLNA